MTESTVLSATAGTRSLSVKERAPEVARPEVTTADVLHRAADLIEEFGWCQGNSAVDAKGQLAVRPDSGAVAFCALGAVARAVMDLTGHDFTYGGFHSTAARRLDSIVHRSTADWNDDPERTKAEVVDLLRQTANAQAFAPKDGVFP